VGRRQALLSLLALVAVAIAGCGGGDATSSSSGANGGEASSPSSKEALAARPEGAEIWRADAAGVGLILFNDKGFTLYRFEGDKGTTSTCYGACARKWPPVLTKGKPKPRAISQAKLRTTKRKDGTVQVTYAGHPLYTFTGDKQTGETNGNGVVAFGGKWHALHPSGKDAAE
jgi:predicted lipoprotein with Yx(FWY)xxD motif